MSYLSLFFSKYTMWLLAVAALPVSCLPQSSLPARWKEQPKRRESGTEAGRTSSAMRQACESAGGSYHTTLLACNCPPGLVYSCTKGCTSVRGIERVRASWAHKTTRSLGDLHLSWPDPDMGPQLDALAEGLRGIKLDSSSTNTSHILLLVRKGTVSQIEYELNIPQTQGPLAALTAMLDPTTIQQGSLPIYELTRRCQSLAKQLLSESGPYGADASICRDFQQALRAILDERLPMPESPQVSSSGEGSWDLWVTSLPESLGQGKYRVIGKEGILPMRSLELHQGASWQFDLLLSPQGAVMAGRLIHRVAGDATAQSLWQSRKAYFTANLVPLTQQTLEFGARCALQDALSRWMAQGDQTIPRLESDDNQLPSSAPLRAMMIEDGVDLRHLPLLNRLDLRRDVLSQFVKTGELIDTVWRSPRPATPLEAAMAVAPSGSPSAPLANHGTLVGTLMAANLHGLQLTVPHLYPGWTASSQKTTDRLIQDIEASRPLVVNISRAFQDDFADCDSVFGPIFKRFRRSVLFIVAAGNDSSHDPHGVCPGSLASTYDNVISVAGVDSNGHLDPDSNYGTTIDVAAPYCAADAILGHDASLPSSCGTSFAAPIVANAALKLLAAKPNLRPQDLKRELRARCGGVPIEVGCGGHLTLSSSSPEEDRAAPGGSQ